MKILRWDRSIAVSSRGAALIALNQGDVNGIFIANRLLFNPASRPAVLIPIEHPQEVGRGTALAHSVAGFHLYGGPCIVIDLGTATTFDAVSEKGEYLGGVIAPGMMISGRGIVSAHRKIAAG